MTVPNFTAERSLYQTSAHYRGTASFGCAEGTIQLAVKSPQCMANCSTANSGCKAGCLEGPTQSRGACMKNCTKELKDCQGSCPDITLTPPPPPTYPPVTTSTFQECVLSKSTKRCVNAGSEETCRQQCRGGFCEPGCTICIDTEGGVSTNRPPRCCVWETQCL